MDEEESLKWYEKHWVIWVLTVVITPLGLFLMWRYSRHGMAMKIAATVIFGLLFLVKAYDPPANQHSTITTTTYATVMYGGTWWVPYEHLDEWITALQRRDVARLTEMANTHKTFKVDRDTVVLRSDSGIYSGVVFITFQEGKYSGLSGYTLSNCVRE